MWLIGCKFKQLKLTTDLPEKETTEPRLEKTSKYIQTDRCSHLHCYFPRSDHGKRLLTGSCLYPALPPEQSIFKRGARESSLKDRQFTPLLSSTPHALLLKVKAKAHDGPEAGITRHSYSFRMDTFFPRAHPISFPQLLKWTSTGRPSQATRFTVTTHPIPSILFPVFSFLPQY